MAKDAITVLDEVIGEPFTFGEMIKTIRQTEYENMTQQQFAEMLDISKTRLSDIENDRKPVSVAKAIQLADQLGQSKQFFVATVFQDMVDRNHLGYKVELHGAA